ncbi:type I restriction enzyme HsdR N-terminal domain-containing protein [Aeromonas allosaccharophila]
MVFLKFDFCKLNEQDVREEIIAPLLRELGYRSGTSNNIVREQTLTYAKSSLGRKKATDPYLKGRADYILETENNVRWIIEAKSPSSDITEEDIQQAWTYANHPEVRAYYYVLCNGLFLYVYITNKGPQNGAVFSSSYDDLSEKFIQLKNILSPEAIMRDLKDIELDLEPPIGEGLRSTATVVNGQIVFRSNSLQMPHLQGLTLSVKSGFIKRGEENNIIADIHTVSPFHQLQEINERLGLHKIKAIGKVDTLSSNKNFLTELEYFTSNTLLQGESMLDLSTMNTVILPIAINVETSTYISGFLEKGEFKGRFSSIMNYVGIMRVSLDGEFNILLS